MALPAVSKLVLEAYLVFLRVQKLRNVFYCVPWQTINMLFPVTKASSGSASGKEVDFCHGRIIDTLHATYLAMKELRVLDTDSID